MLTAKEIMKFQAVIFDLFGTLIDDFSASAGPVNTEMAAALGVPYEQFMSVWHQTLEMRIVGAFETVEANIAYVLNALNEHARVEQIENAVEIRMRCIGQVLQPKPDAVSTLSQLKTRGFKLGLISNASIEIPLLWHETAFADLIDEPIFSSRAHLKKPDTRIYHLACERLAVSPESCLYVGDGEDRELCGAAKVGLHPVLIRPSSQSGTGKSHQDAKEWQGPTITRLPEILQLL
jgi:putative hydrolase of the HAD superfamily